MITHAGLAFMSGWTPSLLAGSPLHLAPTLRRSFGRFFPETVGSQLLRRGLSLLPATSSDWLNQESQSFDDYIKSLYGKTFNSIAVLRDWPVFPFQDLLNRPSGGSAYQGGPALPSEYQLPALFHFRGTSRLDDPVLASSGVDHGQQILLHGRYFWCGPICHHFGHQIADFSGRVLLASLDPRPGRLLWHWYRPPCRRPSLRRLSEWQRTLMRYLNPLGKPVTLLQRPARVEELVIVPQQQRMRASPTPDHLAALTICSRQWIRQPIDRLVYVSRSRYSPCRDRVSLRGSFAGEIQLEQLLQERGAMIVYPESLSLSQQLGLYRNARAIVFAEGSAQHGLELMGYQPQTRVMVICRRPQLPGMDLPLRARFPSLYFCQAVCEYFAPPDGVAWDAIAMLDMEKLSAGLADFLGLYLDAREIQILQKSAENQVRQLQARMALVKLPC